MSFATSLVTGVATVALAPLNYFVFPILSALWQLAKHLVMIPCLSIARIVLYGTIYLPLTVVLSVADIPYDTLCPVEVSLYRFFVSSWPHMAFLLLNLLHYFIVSAIIGVVVGVVSGTNMSVVGYLLTWSTPKQPVSVKTQTTPYLNAKAELTWNKYAASVKHESRVPLPKKLLPLNVDAHMPSDTLNDDSYSLHGLHPFEGLDAMPHHDLSFSTIKEETEPEEPAPLTEMETLAGLGNPDTISTVPSLFSKGQNGDTFSTAVSNRGLNLKQYKHTSL